MLQELPQVPSRITSCWLGHLPNTDHCLLRVVVVALGLFYGASTPRPACAETSDSLKSDESQTSAHSIRDFHRPRFGVELSLGGGISDPLAKVRPPDSIPFTLGHGGWHYELRLRGYVGPLGVMLNLEKNMDPFQFSPDEFNVLHGATSLSFRVLFGLPIEVIRHHAWLEPLWGYGFLNDAAHTQDNERGPNIELYREEYHGKGMVRGLGAYLYLGRGIQFKGIYLDSDYTVRDRRLKIELNILPLRKEIWTDSTFMEAGAFLALGLHLAEKDDGRIDRIIYLGIGIGDSFDIRNWRK